MVVVQAIMRRTVVAGIPIFPHREYWFGLLNIFFYKHRGIAEKLDNILQTLILTNISRYDIRNANLHGTFIYPFAKSKRKSWKPILWRSHFSHPIMSFRTNAWVWSMFGTPWKLSPVLRLPWMYNMDIRREMQLQEPLSP